ncbi:MAG: hypothetical protein CSA35_07060 [Dethiosulfovibrio peptidovorans]|nr:MAG: hypothetical protein CSA35_07060 [Dethiosulfovibrio peptidovorans]
MPEAPHLGYVQVVSEAGAFRGALLVVDCRGIPLDFRYTDPVSPTKLERVLYGDALEVYIQEDVILGSLLGAVEEKPDLWICQDRHLLAPLGHRAKKLSIVMETTSRTPLEKAGATTPLPEENVYLVQTDLMGPPCRVTTLKSGELERVSPILVDAASTMELLEPFVRITKALDVLD